ncbi:MAG TPA: hypothetical protein VFB31_09785 [Pseudolabrys sp.]|nr:hypothetical protein [Pseudolabrys sp.]
MPTATKPQRQAPPQPANDDIAVARQAPPPPGMGKLVDKTV